MPTVTIMFKDSSKPKDLEAIDVYTKGEMLCLVHDGLVSKYPLMNIHCVQHNYNFRDNPELLKEET